MQNVGVIGLGDMGSGLALNLIKAGFTVYGFDLLEERIKAFEAMGGKPMRSSAEVGQHAQKVFVMVMTGDQCNDVILGSSDVQGEHVHGKCSGLISTMKPGGVVLLTATVNAFEARAIYENMQGSNIELIDTPVSGGFPGAQGGTLTLMAAAKPELLAECRDVMEAVSATQHIVGEDIGMGQTVKACLQSLIGSIFSATFEASVLAAKAGVSGEILHKVIGSSSAGCVVADTALENIIDRKFEKTGSHIATMYKDLTIVMDLARDLGVPLFTASTAMQLFQAGITRYPDGDNWCVTQISEDIVDARLTR